MNIVHLTINWQLVEGIHRWLTQQTQAMQLPAIIQSNLPSKHSLGSEMLTPLMQICIHFSLMTNRWNTWHSARETKQVCCLQMYVIISCWKRGRITACHWSLGWGAAQVSRHPWQYSSCKDDGGSYCWRGMTSGSVDLPLSFQHVQSRPKSANYLS